MKMAGLAIAMLLFVSIDSNSSVPPKHHYNILNLSIKDFLQLTPQQFYKLTGYRMKFKDRVKLAFLKLSMKKAIKKNRDMTVKEFLGSKKEPGAFGAVALVLGAILLVMFVLFMVLYKP